MTKKAYRIFVLDKTLVVTADGDKKQQAVDILKTVDPLLAFRPLSTNVKHAVCELAEIKKSFSDASCAQS